jgi:hypothetical protein
VAELEQRFEKEHIAVRLKPGTEREYRRNLAASSCRRSVGLR